MLKRFTCILLAWIVILSAFDIKVTLHKGQIAKANPILTDDQIQHCDFAYFIHPIQCKDESGFTYKINFKATTGMAAVTNGLSGHVKATPAVASLINIFLFREQPAKQIGTDYFCLSLTTLKVALHSLCCVFRI